MYTYFHIDGHTIIIVIPVTAKVVKTLHHILYTVDQNNMMAFKAVKTVLQLRGTHNHQVPLIHLVIILD